MASHVALRDLKTGNNANVLFSQCSLWNEVALAKAFVCISCIVNFHTHVFSHGVSSACVSIFPFSFFLNSPVYFFMCVSCMFMSPYLSCVAICLSLAVPSRVKHPACVAKPTYLLAFEMNQLKSSKRKRPGTRRRCLEPPLARDEASVPRDKSVADDDASFRRYVIPLLAGWAYHLR